MGPVNGIIGGDVQVIDIFGDGVARRYVRKILVFGAGHNLDFPQFLGILNGFGGPSTCIDISGLPIWPQEVHRDHGELEGGASLQIEDLKVIPQPQQPFDGRSCFVHHPFEIFVPMGHLDERKACPVKIQQGGRGLFKDRAGKNGGPGAKIVNFHRRNSRVLC